MKQKPKCRGYYTCKHRWKGRANLCLSLKSRSRMLGKEIPKEEEEELADLQAKRSFAQCLSQMSSLSKMQNTNLWKSTAKSRQQRTDATETKEKDQTQESREYTGKCSRYEQQDSSQNANIKTRNSRNNKNPAS